MTFSDHTAPVTLVEFSASGTGMRGFGFGFGWAGVGLGYGLAGLVACDCEFSASGTGMCVFVFGCSGRAMVWLGWLVGLGFDRCLGL